MERSAEGKFRLSGYRLDWPPDSAATFGPAPAPITRTDQMHRGAVFVDACAQECMVDRADRYPASMIGLKLVCNSSSFAIAVSGFANGRSSLNFMFLLPVISGEALPCWPSAYR